MKYCKECGQELKEGGQYCNECGTPVDTTITQPNPQGPTIPQTNQSMTRLPMTKKNKKLLVVAGTALVILIGGYKTGEALTSKDRLINKFETALVEKDAAAAAKLLSSDDKKAELNEKTVKGFMKYFEKHPEEVTDLIRTLKTESKLMDQTNNTNPELNQLASDFLDEGFVTLEMDGKFLFFDKYRLTVPTVYLALSTNYKNSNLYIDGKKLGKSNKPNFEHTYGPFLPGIYKIKADLKTDFVDLVKEDEILLNDSKEEASLYLEGENVTVDLGMGEANTAIKGKLFINGKDVKVNPFANPTFGPVLTDGSMKLAVEAETPWGKIKTAEVPIKDSDIYLNLGSNESFQIQIMDQIMKFTDQYLTAITSGTTNNLTTATSNLKNKTQEFIKSEAEYQEMYQGQHLSTTFDLNSFQVSNIDGVWSVNVDTSEKYNEDYFYSEDTPSLEETEHQNSYNLVYDEKNKNWLIDNLDDAWSFDDENTKVVKVDKPKTYVTSGTATTATGTVSFSKDEVESFMKDYLTSSVSAINNTDFSIMESYLTPDGKSYKESKDYIDYLKKKGITEDLLSVSLSNMEPTTNGYQVYTDEQYNIHYGDGTSMKKSYTSQYLLKIDGSNLKVDSLVKTSEK
ncbi:putative membrane protein YvbJ [Bacillus sp. SORGH_AS 510]|uniref:zinc ribbon domain-containing protein n=1 Tax=Bacillus sp. SORGH_AS_0510 TaxID=3041771 RepID=UPI00278508EC|nr:hypothetical protein [Bacillus sp. SORGH_AS_0510]MDQ1144134.1 putative membrane protein YvbJ [Bacillus sp. SORGH_AS_0510]